MSKKRCKPNDRLLPYKTIQAASKGDTEAMYTVLRRVRQRLPVRGRSHAAQTGNQADYRYSVIPCSLREKGGGHMRDIPYTSKLTHTEDGKPLALDYYILVSGGGSEPEQYGVKIIEKDSGAQSLDFDLTSSMEKICGLMEQLSRNSVTPTSVDDVLADWL